MPCGDRRKPFGIVLGHALDDVDRAVLAAGAADGDGEVTAIVRLIFRYAAVDETCDVIDETADAGFPNVITFSGNREKLPDDEGLANCVLGLKKIAGYAEQKKITICLEFLNSHDHTDYMADSTKWCVELVHQVGSPRVKVLYDIYHAGRMNEDVLADIKNHADCWGHYHTGGVPGRNEIDETQTLDYRKIMQAIVASGYTGYVGQEFIPKRADALKSLRQAIAICDV